jgi:2-C-methyl-D-erythritol 4-phosphate cytidylyltransferase
MNYWAVIPAAGVGSRMQSEIPKQYLRVSGRCVLEHTLDCFCSHPRITGIVVVLAAGDNHWKGLPGFRHARVMTAPGGVERFHSVLNGLRHLHDRAGQSDWVLVHDAVRPCLHHADIDALIEAVRDHPVGGLLALPVRDTMKRADASGEVIETVSRGGLWHALTPQMFRLAMLEQAIERAIDESILITDEAQAMERCGHRPLLVEGRADNIKITRPGDLALAELFLSNSGVCD